MDGKCKETDIKPVSIIGMGLSPKDLTAAHLKLIKEAEILIGGKRHLDFFKDYPALRKDISKDIKGIIKYIKDRMENSGKSIVVLASGDPLFYGIGSLLINSLGKENVCIYPNITTIAGAFSRIKESWQDVCILSIHGRFCEETFLGAFLQNDKIALFTDPVKNPSWIADFLLKKGVTNFKMCVFERLGTDSEKISWHTLTDAASSQFSEPNLVVLKRIFFETGQTSSLYTGMPDECYFHQNGLITKAEVRAVTLSKLRLSSGHILWDLGAGSGSVSIEASLFITKGNIFAVERNPDRIEQIKKNKKKFGVTNLKVIDATLPDGLDNLPEPDRIFIGGGGKNLEKIIRSAARYLKPGGIMVINAVLIQNIESAINTIAYLKFKPDIVQVQINRGQDMPWGKRLEAQNPVWIISGKKSLEREV